ncbi:MAG: SdiA-regulated domain-containing protein [Chitinophagaceae bacterium]
MAKAAQLKLPLELDEISGVAYYPVDSSVFAISDEKGWLYKIKKGRDIQRWKFSKGADFEDVVLLDSIFYVLQSNGNIMRLSFGSQNSVAVQQFNFTQSGESKNEFEILYYDIGKKKLILICKDCETDKKKALTTFSFDPYSGTYNDSSFSINVKEIAATVGEKSLRFKPSAASINPKNGLLYIISAINKLLVITDVNGNFKNAYKIDETIFKQPEGLTFTPSGGMIISNEAANTGVADILYFSYNKK